MLLLPPLHDAGNVPTRIVEALLGKARALGLELHVAGVLEDRLK